MIGGITGALIGGIGGAVMNRIVIEKKELKLNIELSDNIYSIPSKTFGKSPKITWTHSILKNVKSFVLIAYNDFN